MCTRGTQKESGNICNGEVEEVDIGSGPHVLVVDNDNTSGNVTADSKDHEDGVDDGERQESLPVDAGVPKGVLDESGGFFVLNDNFFAIYFFDKSVTIPLSF